MAMPEGGKCGLLRVTEFAEKRVSLLMVSKVPDETRPNPQNGCVNALNKFPSHSCRLPHLTPGLPMQTLMA